MTLTVYSLIMAVIWFDVFVLLGSLLQRKLHLFLNYNFYPVILLIVLSLIRLFAPVETPLTIIIRSETVAPAIQSALKADVVLGESVAFPAFESVVFVATAVSLVLLIRLFRTYWRGFKAANSYPETDDKRLLDIMDRVVKNTRPGQVYRLCVLDQNISPAICGLRKPTIILPVSLLSMTDEDIRYVLLHEWRHHLEKDLWVKLFIDIICCVMWWNPVVYLLKRDIDQTFELKCDFKTTESLMENDRLDYLSTLLKVARMQQPPAEEQSAAIHFTGSASQNTAVAVNTKQRFQTVLQYSRRNRKIEVVCIACLLALFLMSFRFVVQPYFAPPMEDLTGQIDGSVENVQFFTPTPENSYILKCEDGTYLLYFNGQLARPLSPNELVDTRHKDLPIIIQEKEEAPT